MYLAAEGEELKFSGRGGADRVRGAVLRRHRRLRPQQGRDRDGRLLERGADHAARRRRRSRCSTAPWKRRRSPRPTAAWSTSRPTRIEAPNWLRDGKTLIYNSGGRIYRIPAAGGKPEVDRHRLRHPVQQRPRRLARRHAAGHQRPVAGRAAVAHLHAAGRRRDAEARHAERPVLLARLVARRQDAGLLRRARTASSTSTRSPPTAARRRA